MNKYILIDTWLNEKWYKAALNSDLKLDSDFIRSYQGLVNFNINRALFDINDMTSVRDYKENKQTLKKNGFEIIYDDVVENITLLYKNNRLIFTDPTSMIMFYQYQSDKPLPSYISYKSNYERYHDVYCGEIQIKLGVITINKYMEENGEFMPWEFDLFPENTQLLLRWLSSICNNCLGDFF